ncbi:MAG: FkbM family methyltransferase [Candidatus Nitrosocaldaceae archaeon]
MLKDITYKDFKFKVIDSEYRNHESIYEFYTELDLKERYIHDLDTFVDVGAAYGGYTIISALQGIKTISFEPNYTIFQILVNNVDVNNLKDVTLYNYGLGKEENKLRYNEQYQTTLLDGEHEIVIKTLDEFIDEIKGNTLIKIDTEGMELDVLKGASNILKLHPKLLIEVHENVPWLNLHYKQDIIDYLKSYDYEIKNETSEGRIFIYSS